MASKRGPTSHLDHDNWDHEEKREEAGVFGLATPEQMQTRVIKKARRRHNPTGEEGGGKNLFSGFKGFGNGGASPSFGSISSNSPALFDFLKKPDNNDANKSAATTNIFGTDNNKGSSSNIFGFNSPRESQSNASSPSLPATTTTASTAATTTSATTSSGGSMPPLPMPDGAAKSTCMVPNEPEATTCVCCTTPRPGSATTVTATSAGSSGFDQASTKITSSGFSFGQSANTANNSTSGFKFGSNPATTSPSYTFGSSEKPPATENSTKSPHGFSFGSSSSNMTSSFTFGSSETKKGKGEEVGFGSSEQKKSDSSGFSFGTPASKKPDTSDSKKTETSGFSFGATSAVKSDEKGFTFGASSPSKTSNTGTGASTDNTGSKGFSFRASDVKNSESPSFTFGSSGAKKKESQGFSFGSSSAAFSFGATDSKVAENAGFNFGGSKAKDSINSDPLTSKKVSEPSVVKKDDNSNFKRPSTSSKDIENKCNNTSPEDRKLEPQKEDVYSAAFCSHLKALNNQFSSWIANQISRAEPVRLSPIFKDYEKHFESLLLKYNSNTEASKKDESFTKVNATTESNTKRKSNGEESKPLLGAFFGTPANKNGKEDEKTDKSTTNLFSFGQNTTGVAGTFGYKTSDASSAPFGSAPQTSSGGFSFTFAKPAPAPEDAKPTEDENEPSDEPPKVEISQVQEEDAFYSVRCKLFYKKDSTFADKGVGMLHLKRVENSKTQLVVRAETNLGNVLLNILVTDQMNVVERKNNLQFVCVPNPPIKGVPEGPVSMLVKVKTSELASELATKIKEACKE